MSLTQQLCSECNSENIGPHCHYTVKSGESRTLFVCRECGHYFSEMKNTPLAGLKTPVSRISLVLDALNDGMGLNAVCCTFHVGKNTVKRWVKRLGWPERNLVVVRVMSPVLTYPRFHGHQAKRQKSTPSYEYMHSPVRRVTARKIDASSICE